MALVTVQRSPNSPGPSTDESDSLDTQEGDEEVTDKKGISECYFAVKGAALVLPHDECIHVHRKNITKGACDIQQHLQSMLYLLHADDILKMAVKLESIHGTRNRYLVVLYHGGGMYQTEESCLLGIDCNKETTIGLLLPVWADTKITLDGDGGFSVTSDGRHHIFKPVSVQAMWSALQTLHKASSKARERNYFKTGGTHQWVEYYESHIASDRSCLNEWHAMDDIESRRPPSPDTLRVQPTEREATERHIRTKLKELMMSVDLDEVTSKYIRTRLEEILDMSLTEFKSFIDQEMLTILGQMDAPAEIFHYLYLGSEWNASNLEELVVNGIGHILNVTREIDNFFPGMFDYQNIRVYDDESTEILHYWDKTYRYIRRAKDEGSKVLVHCKMGISRSASVVIAYVMKAYDWDLQRALDFVKTKRGCIKPNSGFLKQLEIYQGILDASKQRHNSLWRSKSETNLKSAAKPKNKKEEDDSGTRRKVPEKSESLHHLTANFNLSQRPKSWSPREAVADMLFPSSHHRHSTKIYGTGTQSDAPDQDELTFSSLNLESATHLSIPRYGNPEETSESSLPRVSSIKDRINELELQVCDKSVKTETVKQGKETSASSVKSPTSRSGLVFNLANQFESGSKPTSPVDEGLTMRASMEEAIAVSQMKPPVCKHHAVLVKPSHWPAETDEVPCKVSPKVKPSEDVAPCKVVPKVRPSEDIVPCKVSPKMRPTEDIVLSKVNPKIRPAEDIVPSKISPKMRPADDVSCIKVKPNVGEICDKLSTSKASHTSAFKPPPSSQTSCQTLKEKKVLDGSCQTSLEKRLSLNLENSSYSKSLVDRNPYAGNLISEKISSAILNMEKSSKLLDKTSDRNLLVVADKDAAEKSHDRKSPGIISLERVTKSDKTSVSEKSNLVLDRNPNCQTSERKPLGIVNNERISNLHGVPNKSSDKNSPSILERINPLFALNKSSERTSGSYPFEGSHSLSECKNVDRTPPIILNPERVNPLCQTSEKIPPCPKDSRTPSEIEKILEPLSPIKSPFIREAPAPSSRATKVNYFYDKEDIPFTPGRVQRTKQEIEEKNQGNPENLVRTISFDSGFPVPIEVNGRSSVKVIRRSHSLRNDCGKWYPLPALATGAIGAKCGLVGRRSASLSVSTPSVVEAVNRVICGTQEVLSGAIPFLKKTSSGSSDSDYDFGSATSLTEIPDPLPPTQVTFPVPGIVQHQKEILKNRITPPEENQTGIVKRLRKELEAKSTQETPTPPSPEDSSENAAKRKPMAPPTPHRKASLDLGFVNRRLGVRGVMKPPDSCIVEIPPAGLTRKLRKQQGSSHPLSKLIKRHPNPLYNTM
ncbi:hypothetical protein JTE90_017704 [Oedothorax gibbosus]|uniref:protein-serine/threonine phosphatase n=1 Tax=Oedothorax gibbosus TaxID=931172 RepID=A0AAV6U964_9ARAC|nr:hypothetical protein JTE90_017704 [Oedothorax gibbosus]